MHDSDSLAEQFESYRAHLRRVAYRMLGSHSEADDAVQETWLRLSRSDITEVGNLGGWLTTVVARVCLDMLRSYKSRREDELDARPAAPPLEGEIIADAEREALLADSIGVALLVVLDTLAPAERVAFVLHDLFDIPFDEIASIVGRTPIATRQLASRARRRVQGAPAPKESDRTRQRELVDAFRAASRSGDLDGLLALLDPDVVLRNDVAAINMGAVEMARGAKDVAAQFLGRAAAARPIYIDGMAGLAWAPGRKPKVVFRFTTDGEKITAIELIADQAQIAQLNVTMRDDT